MPVLKVYLHFIWSTKNRTPFLLNPEIRSKMWNHIFENAKQKQIQIINVGGHNDHCHCLLRLKADQKISELIQLLKGESSHWINNSGLITGTFHKEKFSWQNDYECESVSPHLLYAVNDYINIQEEHHKKVSFQEELEKFFKESDLRNLNLMPNKNLHQDQDLSGLQKDFNVG